MQDKTEYKLLLERNAHCKSVVRKLRFLYRHQIAPYSSCTYWLDEGVGAYNLELPPDFEAREISVIFFDKDVKNETSCVY